VEHSLEGAGKPAFHLLHPAPTCTRSCTSLLTPPPRSWPYRVPSPPPAVAATRAAMSAGRLRSAPSDWMGRLSRFSISCKFGVGNAEWCGHGWAWAQDEVGGAQLAGLAGHMPKQKQRPGAHLLLRRPTHLQQLRLVIPNRLPALVVRLCVFGVGLQPGLVALDGAVPHLQYKGRSAGQR